MLCSPDVHKNRTEDQEVDAVCLARSAVFVLARVAGLTIADAAVILASAVGVVVDEIAGDELPTAADVHDATNLLVDVAMKGGAL